MSFPQLVVLGAIAGYTIFLGLPVGRIRQVSKAWQIAAGAASAGILLFLLVEISEHFIEPIEERVKEMAEGGFGEVVLFSLVALAGITVGLLGLVWIASSMRKRGRPSHEPGDASIPQGNPLGLSLMIAIGIGVHNFAEGLAIGQSAASGAASLAVLLVVGFALHNATEGFGITAPLIGKVRPSWGFLLRVGLIGGTPTFLGTIVGNVYSSEILEVLFLALAGGAIIYVIQSLVHSGLNQGMPAVFSGGLLGGFVMGVATEMVIVAAGV